MNLRFMLLAAALTSLSLSAQVAVTYEWLGTVDSDWTNADNWKATGIPDTSTCPSNTIKVVNRSTNPIGQPLIYGEEQGSNHVDCLTVDAGDMIMNGGALTTGPKNDTLFYVGNLNVPGSFTQNGGLVSLYMWDSVYVNANGTGDCVFAVNGGEFKANFRFEMRGGTRGGKAIVDLNGGTLYINQPRPASGNPGANIFNFNGGTLKTLTYNWSYDGANAANNYTFYASPSQIRNGGANFDTGGRTCYVQSPLTHSNVEGDDPIDGGLNKLGTGTLILMGTNTYTGNTLIQGGTITLTTNAVFTFYPKADLTCNAISGAGTLNLIGGFNIDAPAATIAAYVQRTWRLFEPTGLTIKIISETFTVRINNDDYLERQGETLLYKGIVRGNYWTFDGSTGLLTYRPRETVFGLY